LPLRVQLDRSATSPEIEPKVSPCSSRRLAGRRPTPTSSGVPKTVPLTRICAWAVARGSSAQASAASVMRAVPVLVALIADLRGVVITT
jgi:hypothetical protein